MNKYTRILKPLTYDDSKVIPLTHDDSRVIPLTSDTEFILINEYKDWIK